MPMCSTRSAPRRGSAKGVAPSTTRTPCATNLSRTFSHDGRIRVRARVEERGKPGEAEFGLGRRWRRADAEAHGVGRLARCGERRGGGDGDAAALGCGGEIFGAPFLGKLEPEVRCRAIAAHPL